MRHWLLEHLDDWCERFLVAQKQENVRFSAAVLLVSLVPNRAFREAFTGVRNMFMPFRAPAQSQSSSSSSIEEPGEDEMNLEFESDECKQVLHRIIKYLISIVGGLIRYVGPPFGQDKERWVT